MKNLKGKKAILYRRVSTTEQKKTGNSLNSQQNQLIKFCQNKQIHIMHGQITDVYEMKRRLLLETLNRMT